MSEGRVFANCLGSLKNATFFPKMLATDTVINHRFAELRIVRWCINIWNTEPKIALPNPKTNRQNSVPAAYKASAMNQVRLWHKSADLPPGNSHCGALHGMPLGQLCSVRQRSAAVNTARPLRVTLTPSQSSADLWPHGLRT